MATLHSRNHPLIITWKFLRNLTRHELNLLDLAAPALLLSQMTPPPLRVRGRWLITRGGFLTASKGGSIRGTRTMQVGILVPRGCMWMEGRGVTRPSHQLRM